MELQDVFAEGNRSHPSPSHAAAKVLALEKAGVVLASDAATFT
jgi:hypothetical protein